MNSIISPVHFFHFVIVGLLKDDTDDAAKIAYQSYVSVVGSPPLGFENFTVKVNAFMESPPFNFPNVLQVFGGMKRVSCLNVLLVPHPILSRDIHLYNGACAFPLPSASVFLSLLELSNAPIQRIVLASPLTVL